MQVFRAMVGWHLEDANAICVDREQGRVFMSAASCEKKIAAKKIKSITEHSFNSKQ